MAESGTGRARVVVLTTNGTVSYRILARSLADPAIDVSLMVVLPSSGSRPLKSVLQSTLRRSGLRMVTYKAVMSATAAFQRATASLVAKGDGATPVGLASRDRIPTLHATDCNDPALVGLIAAVEPDFLISVNVYQRVDEPLLAAPRIAALNTHFGMLPNYRGMSPVVWALAHGEQEIGITIHRMVIRFDEGQVIAQESLPLEPHESVMSVTFRGADRASQMLSGSVVRLMKDPSAGIAQEGSGSYFSLPTKQAIRQLSARGHKLWRWKDLSQFWKQAVTGAPLQ